MGVGNGSFKDKVGTACWILENTTGKESIVGLIDVPGHDDTWYSHGGEYVGEYSEYLWGHRLK